MSDVSEGSGPIPRRTARAGEGSAPVSGALAIGLAIVAVIAGFFILRSISEDGANPLDAAEPSTDGQTTATTPQDGSTPGAGSGVVPSLASTPTPSTLATTGASVIVSNANGKGGSAAVMSTALQGVGFLTVDPTNSDDTIDVSIIYFDSTQAAAQQVASSVSIALGGDVVPQPLPPEIPIADGDMKGAGVLLMLGTDKVDFVVVPVNPPAAAVTPVVTTLPAG